MRQSIPSGASAASLRAIVENRPDIAGITPSLEFIA